jgi:tRNA dimethylallyltransferase
LEVYELTGKPISQLQEPRRLPREQSRGSVAGSYLLIGLDLPRPELYERIEQRVDGMIAKGLIEEVKGLLAKGYSKDLNSFQALGYKEVVDYLDGKWDQKTMVDELKKRTRHFARRQMTWFRRFTDVTWFPPGEKDAIIQLCQGPDSKR